MMYLISLLLILLLAAPVWAQMDSRGVILKDEGATQGSVNILDCVGTGVACTRSGATGTLTISGGGGGYNQIQEEGSNLTQRVILNFIGTSITCVDDGASKTNCTITAGAGASWTEHEIDLDVCGVSSGKGSVVCKKTVTDAGVSTTSKVIAIQSAKAATGRQADENEMDPFTCRVEPGTGQFTLICKGYEGPIHGKYLIWYTVG